jgi:hypothetical protein
MNAACAEEMAFQQGTVIAKGMSWTSVEHVVVRALPLERAIARAMSLDARTHLLRTTMQMRVKTMAAVSF